MHTTVTVTGIVSAGDSARGEPAYEAGSSEMQNLYKLVVSLAANPCRIARLFVCDLRLCYNRDLWILCLTCLHRRLVQRSCSCLARVC